MHAVRWLPSPSHDVCVRLQGNARFWMGLAERPEMSAMERRALIMAQSPKVAVLGCSDSRVPIEIVFDQGLGDIFAVRVAGNIYGDSTAASLDYAVAHLKVGVVWWSVRSNAGMGERVSRGRRGDRSNERRTTTTTVRRPSFPRSRLLASPPRHAEPSRRARAAAAAPATDRRRASHLPRPRARR